MTMTYKLQVVENAKNAQDAAEMLAGLKLQDGFIAGDIIGGVSKPLAARAFFEDCGPANWLPDGMRRVLVPEWLLKV